MRRILLLCLLLLPGPALATPLVGDLSNYRIDIDSGFNGTRIFLFGARNDIGDVVAVVRGPHRDYMVRRKESIGGVWVNRERMKLFDMPEFYAIAASRPLSEIGAAALFRRLGIGQEFLFSPPADEQRALVFLPFAEAFLRHQTQRKLYADNPEPVTFMGETLFKTVVAFPDNIPSGNYTAEIYLISDGEVTGMQSTPITVVKSGVDAFLYDYAHERPFFYGITAVVLALAIGWFVGRAFEKV